MSKLVLPSGPQRFYAWPRRNLCSGQPVLLNFFRKMLASDSTYTSAQSSSCHSLHPHYFLLCGLVARYEGLVRFQDFCSDFRDLICRRNGHLRAETDCRLCPEILYVYEASYIYKISPASDYDFCPGLFSVYTFI